MSLRRALVNTFLMVLFIHLSEGRDLLFTPGPLTTTEVVKDAMTRDQSLTQTYSKETVEYIRQHLLHVDNLSPEEYTVIPLQGSATFAIESVIHSATPRNGRVLVLKNGHFGDNLEMICKMSNIDHDVLDFPDGGAVDIATVERQIITSPIKYTTVVMVHHETSFSVMNPIVEVGKLVTRYLPDAAFIVDSVGSFACYPMPMEEAGITVVISSPNKCLEGFPGIAFVIARRHFVEKSKGNARSALLDLTAEYEKLERTGTNRFTWPLQVYSALAKGLELFFKEGRIHRMRRYMRNNNIIRAGMKRLRFQEFRQANTTRSVLLTVYKWPTHNAFDFPYFIKSLEAEGMHIYAISLSKTPIMRVANMGQLTELDCHRFLGVVEKTMKVMGVHEPNPE